MTTKSESESERSDDRLEFSTSDEAIAFIKSQLQHFPPISTEINFPAFVEEFGILGKVPLEAPLLRVGLPILVKRFRWVVRNDDLNLVDGILEGLRGSASAGFFLAAGVTAPAQ
jgi:hypothetical protein